MGKLIIPNIGNNINLDNITATSNDILQGKTTINSNGEYITGNIPSISSKTITPSRSNQTINAGNYLSGNITISGDADLIAANIKSGKNIFNVAGTCKEYKQWGGTLRSSTSRKAFGSMGNWYYLTCSPGFTIKAVTGHVMDNGSSDPGGHELIGMDTWNYILMNSDNRKADYFANGISGLNNGTTWYLPVYQNNQPYYIFAFGY